MRPKDGKGGVATGATALVSEIGLLWNQWRALEGFESLLRKLSQLEEHGRRP